MTENVPMLLYCLNPTHNRSMTTMSNITNIKTHTKILLIAVTTLFSMAASAEHHGDKAKMKDKMASMDIVDTAVAAGSFNTLATALTEAGLIDTLKGEGPFTVFAPTDEAFAKIPSADLEAILADKEKLTAILTYHVVAGKVMAADVVTLTSADTVQGSSIAIDTSSGVMVNNANVIKTDIETSNGVIHVIDTVLVPE